MDSRLLMLKANNIKPKCEWTRGRFLLPELSPLSRTVRDSFPSYGSPVKTLIIRGCVFICFPFIGLTSYGHGVSYDILYIVGFVFFSSCPSGHL